MGTFLALVGTLLLFAGGIGLLTGLGLRLLRRPVARWLRPPVTLTTVVLGVVLAGVAGSMLPKPVQPVVVPQPKVDVAAVTPTATPKVEPKLEAVENQPQESQDLAEQETAPPAPPQPEVQRVSVGLFLVKCRDAVRSQLKSPSSARFPSSLDLNAAAREMDDGSWALGSFVEAQNAFGTEIRSTFTCTYNPSTQAVTARITD